MKITQYSPPLRNCYLMSVIAFIAFVLIFFGLKLWVIGAYGSATPFWDQWDTEAENLYKPFLEGRLNWIDLFAPHNEHRMLTTNILALSLLVINGIWNPILQMEVNAVIHIATIGISIAMLTRVIGRNHLPAMLGFSLILFGFPYAWENTLLGIGSQFYFVLLFSVTSLWFILMRKPFSVGWWGGMLAGILAFFSVASGVLVLVSAAGVSIILFAIGRQRTHQQLGVIAILISIFMLGVKLTPSVTYHAHLKASSIPQFIDALEIILGWPISSNFISALFRNLPALIFLGVTVWKRPLSNDRRWFLIGLVLWIFGQAAIIAYGRAVGNLAPRYLDFFAINILVNFACLISLSQDYVEKRLAWAFIIPSIWILTLLIYLGMFVCDHTWIGLTTKRETGLAQEINMRNYLATGDLNQLRNKPLFYVPYPDSERLAIILSSSSVQKILPSNIRVPLKQTFYESNPTDAFVVNGFNPASSKRSDLTLGSYSEKGNTTIGNASIQFDTNHQNTLVAIPVSGYPLSSGIKLEVEQNGQRKLVKMDANPSESWTMVYVKVANGPFLIHLTDSSATAWLAIGQPFVAGRLDAFTNGLLTNYFVFIFLGLLLGLLLLTQSGLTNHVTRC